MLKIKTNRSFDLCRDSGAAAAFFPSGRGALSGNYTEVSCTEWTGDCPTPLWNNWCMGNNTTPLWPGKGCGNAGTRHSLPCAVIQFRLIYTPKRILDDAKWDELFVAW